MKETINLLKERKEDLLELGITEELFWRFGVAKRYNVTKREELTVEQWNEIKQSLSSSTFALWIRNLSEILLRNDYRFFDKATNVEQQLQCFEPKTKPKPKVDDEPYIIPF